MASQVGRCTQAYCKLLFRIAFGHVTSVFVLYLIGFRVDDHGSVIGVCSLVGQSSTNFMCDFLRP